MLFWKLGHKESSFCPVVFSISLLSFWRNQLPDYKDNEAACLGGLRPPPTIIWIIQSCEWVTWVTDLLAPFSFQLTVCSPGWYFDCNLQEPLSQTHLARLLLNSWPTETKDNKFCFKISLKKTLKVYQPCYAVPDTYSLDLSTVKDIVLPSANFLSLGPGRFPYGNIG